MPPGMGHPHASQETITPENVNIITLKPVEMFTLLQSMCSEFPV